MPRFRYEARDGAGERSSDELEADSPSAVFDRLERQGLKVVSVVAVAGGSPKPVRLGAGESAELARQIGLLAASGLPIPSGLRALREEMPSRRLRLALDRLADHLEGGESIEDALGSEGAAFPDHIRGLIEAGSRSGRLGEVLAQFADLDRASADRERSLRASLAYPVLLMAAAAAVFLLLMSVVLDSYVSIFKDFGIDLPWITRLLISVGSAVRGAGPWAILGPLAAIAALRLIEMVVMSPAERRRLANEIPLFGPLWRWSSMAEFSHLLAVLLEADVPLPKALPLAARGVRDPALLEAGRRLASEIEAGSTLAEAVSWSASFPAGFARILRWAEPYQGLPEALHMAGALYEARAKTQATFVSTVLTVVTVVFTLVLAAFAYIGLFLPLLRLISILTG